MADPASSRWNVRITFVCADNAQSKEVREAIETIGDRTKTELLVADTPEDVRVLQVVAKTVSAADETEVYTRAEKRYGPAIEIAEEWNVDVEPAQAKPDPEPEADADEDETPASPAAQALSEEELEIAREKGDLIEADPLQADAEVDNDGDEYDLQATLQDLGPELLEIARERGWATTDPLSPDFEAAPEPLSASERSRLANLIAEAVESGEGARTKQWYLWQIAREAGIDDLVRDVFTASGYDPVRFDDADFMGVAPGTVGLPTLDDDDTPRDQMTVGDLIEQLKAFDPSMHVIHLGDEEGNRVDAGVSVSSGFHYRESIEMKTADGKPYEWTRVEEVAEEDTEDDDGSLPCVVLY